MADPYIGQIMAVAFNFVPVGWLACNGQTLSISQYDVLFALIGMTYGGDGQTTFNAPNLNGRVPLGAGTSGSGTTFLLGEIGGTESVTLTSSQVGPHSHALLASAQAGSTITPGPGEALAVNAQVAASMYSTAPVAATLSPNSITSAGGNEPHENRQPYQAIQYIICVEGIFPPQS